MIGGAHANSRYEPRRRQRASPTLKQQTRWPTVASCVSSSSYDTHVSSSSYARLSAPRPATGRPADQSAFSPVIRYRQRMAHSLAERARALSLSLARSTRAVAVTWTRRRERGARSPCRLLPMYPPPHMTHMYPPPHMTHMYPPRSPCRLLLQRAIAELRAS
jgi:hypothetical protein